jgi:predicted XRE-type DNA-binding protein
VIPPREDTFADDAPTAEQGSLVAVVDAEPHIPLAHPLRSAYVVHIVRYAILDAIHAWRERRNLSHRQAAALLGCHQSALTETSTHRVSLERLIELLALTGQKVGVYIVETGTYTEQHVVSLGEETIAPAGSK